MGGGEGSGRRGEEGSGSIGQWEEGGEGSGGKGRNRGRSAL